MWRKIAFITFIIVFAFGILFTSILRTAAVRYEFKGTTNNTANRVLGDRTVNIDYYLAYPGKILPDSPLWPLKAARDRVWFWLTTNPSRKAELLLLFADKRLSGSQVLFEKGKADVGFSTLTKGEKYLEEAAQLEKENRGKGINTTEFLTRLAKGSLKHFDVMEEILTVAPEDAKPDIIKTQDFAKRIYNDSKNALLEKGIEPPENPFNWN